MTMADRMRTHHDHCAPHRGTLRMLARAEAGVPLPPGVVQEVSYATSVILADAEAAQCTAEAAAPSSRRRSGVTPFLAARLSRLAAAADDAVTAARDGNTVALRRHLRRFDVLTSAMWTVQLAVQSAAPPRRRQGTGLPRRVSTAGAAGDRH
jgi:hypothetical protein